MGWTFKILKLCSIAFYKTCGIFCDNCNCLFLCKNICESYITSSDFFPSEEVVEINQQFLYNLLLYLDRNALTQFSVFAYDDNFAIGRFVQFDKICDEMFCSIISVRILSLASVKLLLPSIYSPQLINAIIIN